MIFVKDGKEFNPHVTIEVDGFIFPDGSILKYPEYMEKAGISEVQEELPPADYSPDTHDIKVIPDAPYREFPRKEKSETLAILLRRYEQALDGMLNKVAQDNRYDSRVTFALRAGYPGPYQAEGVAFAQWMDSCNLQAYLLMEQVAAGAAQPPGSVDEFLAIFPPFVKP